MALLLANKSLLVSVCFSVPVLAGVERVPERTFIATGRERLICVDVLLAFLGVSKNRYHEVIHSLS